MLLNCALKMANLYTSFITVLDKANGEQQKRQIFYIFALTRNAHGKVHGSDRAAGGAVRDGHASVGAPRSKRRFREIEVR